MSDNRDTLIKELLAESFGLRTKAEQLSQYVETRVAELVKARKALGSHESGEAHRRLTEEIAALRAGLEDVTRQRNELQSRLDELLASHERLAETLTAASDQRDRLRARLAEVEGSREFRLARRLAALLPFLRSVS